MVLLFNKYSKNFLNRDWLIASSNLFFLKAKNENLASVGTCRAPTYLNKSSKSIFLSTAIPPKTKYKFSKSSLLSLSFPIIPFLCCYFHQNKKSC